MFFAVFLIDRLYGFINWRRMERRQALMSNFPGRNDL